jgi:hypothetical protein
VEVQRRRERTERLARLINRWNSWENDGAVLNVACILTYPPFEPDEAWTKQGVTSLVWLDFTEIPTPARNQSVNADRKKCGR